MKQFIVTVAHSKGGSKKSTTAWHLANGLRQSKYAKGRDVVIVDVDVQQTISIVNDIRESSSKFKEFRVLKAHSVSHLLSIFEIHNNDIIVCDTGGFDKDINRVAIERADKLVVPLMASIHDVLGLTMFQSIVSEINASIEVNALLVGVHHKQTNFDDIEKIIEANENATLLKAKILSKNSNYKTMEIGLSVYDTNDELCKRYDEVLDELTDNTASD